MNNPTQLPGWAAKVTEVSNACYVTSELYMMEEIIG